MRVVARDAPGVFLSRLAHHFVKLMLGSCGSTWSNLRHSTSGVAVRRNGFRYWPIWQRLADFASNHGCGFRHGL